MADNDFSDHELDFQNQFWDGWLQLDSLYGRKSDILYYLPLDSSDIPFHDSNLIQKRRLLVAKACGKKEGKTLMKQPNGVKNLVQIFPHKWPQEVNSFAPWSLIFQTVS